MILSKQEIYDNYAIIYFNAVKTNGAMAKNYIIYKLNIFESIYGELGDDIFFDLARQNRHVVLSKLKKYRKYINKGISIKTINTFSYKSREKITQNIKEKIKLAHLTLAIAGIVITAPISLPIILIYGIVVLYKITK